MTPRRVALVCPYSWSYPGGVRTHVSGLARALRAAGVDVDVLAPADGGASRDGIIPLGRSIPISDNGSVQHVALLPTAAARTFALLRAGGYDVVHLHEPMIPFTCLTALLTARAPLVGTFHMSARTARWYRVFAPLSRRALARLRVRTAVSAAARDHVARICPGTYEIVPNGVDVPREAHVHRDPGRTVLFVGRAEPRKGLPVLLEAFGSLPSPTRLELVGPDEADLASAGGSPGAGRVSAEGRVSDAERTRLLLEADVLCAPSLGGESFGLVLAEAMASGVPVVASDVGGYRDLVGADCGRLVPPRDPVALSAALRELLEDSSLRARLGAAARARAESLAWPRVAERILALYERALTESAA
ncbi:MAG: glycosyltransferase family 4 protein [Gaiellaceae bacterium]